MNQQYVDFAKVLVNYSAEVKPGHLVYIDSLANTPVEMIIAIMEAVKEAGGSPYAIRRDERLLRMMNLTGNEQLFAFMASHDIHMIEKCDSGIIFRDFGNAHATADVPSELSQLWSKHYAGKVINFRSPRNWILAKWPTPGMAQLMKMSTEQFEEFYFQTVLFDYAKMEQAALPLKELMDRTDQVTIKGPGDTDLTFSIKDIPSTLCTGKINIPDGEVFTAPVRNSMNGVIQYNTLNVSREGPSFENIRFEVKDGKIITASCGTGDQEKLDSILDTDEGARYFGEFAFGFHPMITTAVGDTLFDEKIKGSFHLTPGKCYESSPNGNASNVHWDIVCIQRPEYGGGEILFDDVLVRQDGLFVLPELEGLNPDILLVA